MATSEHKGFTFASEDGWTTIVDNVGTTHGKVRGEEEARYYVDLYVRQNQPEPEQE